MVIILYPLVDLDNFIGNAIVLDSKIIYNPMIVLYVHRYCHDYCD